MKQPFLSVPPEQIPFIMAGKKYLLLRLLLQLFVVALFVVRLRARAPLVTPLSIAGALLMLAGFTIRRWSMSIMGERFRGYEVRREHAGLETRGPYRVIRHPGYLGLILMDAGLPLLVGVPWALIAVVVLIALVVQRIGLEEQLLARAYPEYADFAATRKRLVPGLW